MLNKSSYLTPRLTARNMDLYLVRRSILRALNETLSRFSGTFLDVGCGHMPYISTILSAPSHVDMYIGLDIRSDIYTKLDVEWDGKVMPFSTDTIDCAMATEVLEHCPKPDIVLAEVLRVLRPGGLFFLTVPFIWPLHDVPYDEYRYTPFALERLLRNAGFGEIELQALGGWDASLAQMIGLWARRRPMSRFLRAILLSTAIPFYAYLVWHDSRPITYSESTMITGISGTAIKPR